MPLSTLHSSASLLRDTPTEGSQISIETSPIRDHHLQNPLPAKKGTRFILPGATDTKAGSTGGQMTPDSPDTMPGKHRRHVETLNVLGQQPGFKEPYPESLCSEPSGAGLEEASSLALPTARPGVASQERADLMSDESLNLPGTTAGSHLDTHTQPHPQELGSGSTLENSSLSQSLIITSSPWLKSSTSKNIEWSPDVTQGDSPLSRANLLEGAHRLEEESKSVLAYGSPMGDKLDGLASTLGESVSSVLGDQSLEPVPGQSVTLPRNVETRCTHYTHSSSALSDGAGVPGSHVAPSTIYRQSVYSPQLTIDMGMEEGDDGETGERCGGDVSGESLVTVARAGRAGIVSWPSEVGLAYTLGMGEVVLYGRTSRIQSVALKGGTGGSGGERVLGLRQLAEFSTNTHASPSKESGTVNIMI